MKKIIFILSVLILALHVCGQDMESIQLQQAIQQHPQQDTAKVNLLNALGYSRSLPGEEIEKLGNEALEISRKTGYAKGEAYALVNLSSAELQMGNRPQAVLLIQQADSIAKHINDQELFAYVFLGIGKVNMQIDNNQALAYKKRAEEIALKLDDKKFLSICQNEIAATYQNSLSDFPKAIEYALKSINSAEEANCTSCLARGWSSLAALYNIIGDQSNSLFYYQKAVEANKKMGDKVAEGTLLNNVGERYRLMGKYSEAIESYNQCLAIVKEPYRMELTESNLADVYTRIDSLPLAFKYAFSSLATAKQVDDQEGVSWIYGILSRAYLKKKMADSAIYYSRLGLDIAKQTSTIEFMRDNAGALANAYAFKKDFENAYTYHTLYINYRDSMLSAEISNKSTVLQYNYNLEKKQAEIAALDQQKKVQQNFLISALIVLLLIFITLIILFRNNRQKLHANKLLKEQKEQIEIQRDQTNKALAELQQTQKQLIQAEKMASLGELTAGIAHEIQNPLNFVNNFSEVNKDLLDEMNEELEKGNLDEVKNIAADVIKNEEKIAFHGRRADAIVKGMLQHSRKNTGQKELTDINVLADEYLRLSYHGLRAKDKTFNTEIKTDFDQSIGKINIVPQDIGRMLLNLYNNAFYAVNEKKKQLAGIYQPSVSISTKKINDTIEITVKDNGNGISQDDINKIFQPFFTTKPTGLGTGLGLSLGYDIIKAHGGEITVSTKQGNGAEFVVQLPVA